MNFSYQGTRVPAMVPTALFEGWEDAASFARMEQLYRRPRWKRVLYSIGWTIGRAAGRRP